LKERGKRFPLEGIRLINNPDIILSPFTIAGSVKRA